MHKSDHSCAREQLHLVLLRGGLGNERGGVEQMENNGQNELDFQLHAIISA
jgi:hypothetical protein